MQLFESAIPLRDPATGAPKDVIANQNVVWSSGETWQGVIAEAYHFEEIDTPEFQTVDHSLVLHLSSSTYIELRTDSQHDNRTRVAGDLSILPAGTRCQVRSRESHEVLVMAISQEIMAQPTLKAVAERWTGPLLHPYLRDSQLEHICRALKAEAESNFPSGTLYGESLALALAAHVTQQYSASDSSASQKGGMAPKTLDRVVSYIEANLDSPITLACLAQIAGLSTYRFAHNFRSAVGLSPYQYVLSVRLARAKQMLRDTNLSIQEIAYSVGCQSSNRFNALFRRAMGTIPSAYRASFR